MVTAYCEPKLVQICYSPNVIANCDLDKVGLAKQVLSVLLKYTFVRIEDEVKEFLYHFVNDRQLGELKKKRYYDLYVFWFFNDFYNLPGGKFERHVEYLEQFRVIKRKRSGIIQNLCNLW